MANFNTHLNVAALLTGVSSASLVAAGHIELDTAIWLWFLGTIGGLLPDIDSDNSTSLDTIFNIFAFSVILIIMRYMTSAYFGELSFVEVIAIPVVTYGLMKYGLRTMFERLTVHRGSCHSLLFLVLCGLLTTQVIANVDGINSDKADSLAWLSGGFVFLGGFIHLMLDEMYSVDLRNIKIKRSFGTALKLVDLDSKLLALGMMIAVGVLWKTTPEIETTLDMLCDWSMFSLV
ncbi:metal-dependent hydrolase [Moritella sp.]|uniref:metal-dependent hydrolase n=1 Tax=Moritella sp. TaxID=78556 RepID=UPI001D8A4BCD|nr:metal-dependent hydrolase [Moritella sp.]MCJ8351458.1 metal-dependent hydrolase [Moritella sp.]NQZ40162.1 metal-dependent hydrolase [Moritella sp.]